jgi:hypothetical protein
MTTSGGHCLGCIYTTFVPTAFSITSVLLLLLLSLLLVKALVLSQLDQ